MKNLNSVPLLVTTTHRGVFFGYGAPTDADSIRITKARMVVYWSADVRSILGLAAHGPSKACRIGPAVPAITLRDVTSVAECSEESQAEFEKGHWAA